MLIPDLLPLLFSSSTDDHHSYIGASGKMIGHVSPKVQYHATIVDSENIVKKRIEVTEDLGGNTFYHTQQSRKYRTYIPALKAGL